MFKKYRQIHFVGIGGVGMSGIAEVLLNLGYSVTGSDLRKSEATERLRSLGADIFLGHRDGNLKGDPSVVVISTAVAAIGSAVVDSRSGDVERAAGIDRELIDAPGFGLAGKIEIV